MSLKKDKFLTRVVFILILFGLMSGGVVYRVFQLSVLQQDKWVEAGEAMFIKRFPIEAERGNILSDDRSLLATEIQFFDLYMDFRASGINDVMWKSNVDSLAILFSKHIFKNKSKIEMLNWLNSKRNADKQNRYVRLKKNATFDQYKMMKSWPILRRGKNGGGFIVERKAKRQKPFGHLASRTIGLSRLNADPVGLELTFDEVLAGEDGSQLMHKTTNAYLPVENVNNIEPRRGKDIVSTLNVNMQDITEQALLRTLEKHNGEYGVAIVMEVETGAIKAIANLGKTRSGKYAEIYNYAVGNATAPGSTMKLASLLRLIEDGYLDKNEQVDLNRGKLDLCNETLHDSEHHNISMATVEKAFEMSSNVGMVQLVRKYYKDNPKKFIEGLYSMGLNKKTGIELIGEAEPLIRHPDRNTDWSCTTLPWTSIGYEMSVTPLQMLNFYNAVANDGKLMKPYLVTSVEKLGHVLEEFEPTVINNSIASKSAITKVQDLLKGVVLRGTASRLKSEYYDFAAKTGTSIIGKKNGRKVYQASFVGYFPSDKPKYSCIVLVNDPQKNGYYGGTVAGPVFREIADKIHASHLEIKKPINSSELKKAIVDGPEVKGNSADLAQMLDDLNYKLEGQASTDWINIKAKKDTLIVDNLPMTEKTIPDVRGMALKDAIYILETRGLKVQFVGLGKVKSQSIRPGTRIADQVIMLNLG